MENNYSLYVVDVESTGLDPIKNDIIEISILNILNNQQKTWCVKPINLDSIELDALRINGHKLEDITHKTKYGRDTYLDPNKAIIEIENWLLDDPTPNSNRVLVGQNISFDKLMMESLWNKCNSKDTFPFGRRMLCTMQIQFMIDLAKNDMMESYSLSSLIKKYRIKNEKNHTAAADVKATYELFKNQLEYIKKFIK